MTVYDWLLFLHVLGAFGMIGSIVFYWGLIVVGGRMDRPRAAAALFPVAKPAGIVVVVGSLMAVAFGLWLTFYIDGYEIFEPWILGTLALWMVAFEAGRRSGVAYKAAGERAKELAAQGVDTQTNELTDIVRRHHGLLMHSIATAALVGALALMIFKPGA